MKKWILLSLLLFLGVADSFELPKQMKPWKNKIETLTPFEQSVVVNKNTETAFSGEYLYTKELGVYRCKVCDTPLYKSHHKFESHCGWPSFDDAIKGAIKEIPDKDGMRVEIVCTNCNAHLGHIFRGEGLTSKNIRHCVNSVSLTLDTTTQKNESNTTLQKAYFSGGCFWGVEYYMEQIEGVLSVVSGFMGGRTANPSYHDVVRKKTGHLETVEVTYDSTKTNYETIAKTFFEIHDPTQTNGQGPDVGEQYHSAVFVSTPQEHQTVESLIATLRHRGYDVATKIYDSKPFYPAEDYHQDYYQHKGALPYCHTRIKRFGE